LIFEKKRQKITLLLYSHLLFPHWNQRLCWKRSVASCSLSPFSSWWWDGERRWSSLSYPRSFEWRKSKWMKSKWAKLKA